MISKQTTYVDSSTGEVISNEIVSIKKVKPDEFIQVYLEDMSGLMKISSKNEINVLMWFWKFSTYVDEGDIGNMVVINSKLLKQIEDSTGICKQSIRNVISSLKKKRLLITEKGERGIYYLNPEYFFKGSIKDRGKCYKNVIEYRIDE